MHVYQLKLGVPINIGPFEITPHRALDADVDSIFQIKALGLNILNVVDSWIDSMMLKQLARSGPWDMILWPFQTMREIEVLAPSRAPKAPLALPSEWIEQLDMLNPRFIIPSSCQFIQESWSWYNQAFFPISYRQFKLEIESALPNVRVVRLNPSVGFALDKKSLIPLASLPWVSPIGEQDVDYDYKANIRPPSTAEISRKFSALTENQTQRVYDYCTGGLIERYKSLDYTEESYFKKDRRWRLSVYDHTGEVKYFYYKLNSTKLELELDSESDDTLSWVTEIPIAKFYTALDFGETLTSMYMRINDMVFDSEIERETNSVDIIDDPLIRCLFSGIFGAYQIAQLKRIIK